MSIPDGPIDPQRLRIRHVEPSDYEAVAATMASPGVVDGTLQVPWSSREGWRKRIADVPSDGCMLVAEVRHAEVRDDASDPRYEIVGNGGLQAFPQQRRRHAVALGMSVRDDWQGRGIGTALMAALLERADGWMNVVRIKLTVFVENARAIALYRRHGFAIEGTHRAYALRDGRYVDAYAMARLHPRPPVLPSSDVP